MQFAACIGVPVSGAARMGPKMPWPPPKQTCQDFYWCFISIFNCMLGNKRKEQSDSKNKSLTDHVIDWPLPNKILGCAVGAARLFSGDQEPFCPEFCCSPFLKPVVTEAYRGSVFDLSSLLRIPWIFSWVKYRSHFSETQCRSKVKPLFAHIVCNLINISS